MKILRCHKIFFLFLSIICFVIGACSKQSPKETATQTASPKPTEKKLLKVKGFYIGMSRESVNSLLDSYALINRNYDSVEKKTFARSNNRNGRIIICYDQSDKLNGLYMESDVIDQLFNTDHMDIQTFAKEFMNSYNLPEMKSMTSGFYGWHYRDEIERFDVEIYRNNISSKNLSIVKTPERKFDIPAANKPFTIKGLYLGMPRESALSQLDSLGVSHRDVTSHDLGYEANETIAPGRVIDIWYDKNDQIARICINHYGADELFNVADLDRDEFVEEFQKNYGFSEMKPFSDYYSSGWCYRDEKQGFEVTITGSKNLRLRQIPKTSEMKFN